MMRYYSFFLTVCGVFIFPVNVFAVCAQLYGDGGSTGWIGEHLSRYLLGEFSGRRESLLVKSPVLNPLDDHALYDAILNEWPEGRADDLRFVIDEVGCDAAADPYITVKGRFKIKVQFGPISEEITPRFKGRLYPPGARDIAAKWPYGWYFVTEISGGFGRLVDEVVERFACEGIVTFSADKIRIEGLYSVTMRKGRTFGFPRYRARSAVVQKKLR